MKSPDVIVVGGGLCGSVAAGVLAKGGADVLLIERGEAPGSKSIMGGVVYAEEFKRALGEFPADAPVERRVVREEYYFHDGKSGYLSLSLKHPQGSSAYTVLRRKFDGWLWEWAKGRGAVLLPKVLVNPFSLIRMRWSG